MLPPHSRLGTGGITRTENTSQQVKYSPPSPVAALRPAFRRSKLLLLATRELSTHCSLAAETQMSPDVHRTRVRTLGRARAETQVRRARSHLMGSVPGISRTRRPAGPATCTWSSSLISMKAGTLMVKAGLRKTLRSRTTPTGRGTGTARCSSQPFPGQPDRAGLVGGARSTTSSPPASSLPRRLLPETLPFPGNLVGWAQASSALLPRVVPLASAEPYLGQSLGT